MTGAGVRLGIDFGTSTTVSVLELPGVAARPLLFDGSPLLPSAVCLDPGGRLLVGRDAQHTALSSPGSFEPHPKRCVDDGTVLLGGSELPVDDLFAAVLRRVYDEASAVSGSVSGGPPDDVVITCPASWGEKRRARLSTAAPAGATVVSEPVAAAHYFTDVAGHRVPDGGVVLVYDLGAGTFDASVVRRVDGRFTVLAAGGLPDTGGLDIDAAVVSYLAATFADRPEWQRLTEPAGTADARARRQLWDNVRSAKEMLSRVTTTMVHIPLLDVEVPLGREQLDRLARPVLDRTVSATKRILADAEVRAGDLVAVFLAGGASRMPLVGTVLHGAFGIAPTTVNQPELAVAEGSLRAASAVATTSADGDWPVPRPVAVPAASGRTLDRRLRVGLIAGAALTIVVLLAVAATVLPSGSDDPRREAGPLAVGATGVTATPTPSASPTPPPGIDFCLLGTWQSTVNRVYGLLDNVRVQYEGGAGVLTTYRADGTGVTDYSGMQPRIAHHRGAVWADVHRGSMTFRYHADNGEFTSSVISSNAVDTLTRNGRYNAGGPVTYYLEPTRYTCAADRLTFISTQGNYSTEMVRVRRSGTPVHSNDVVPR